MAHDPKKNKALCVIAKTVVWTYWGAAIAIILGVVALIAIEVYSNWNGWAAALNVAGSVALALIFTVAFVLIAVWAINYSERC